GGLLFTEEARPDLGVARVAADQAVRSELVQLARLRRRRLGRCEVEVLGLSGLIAQRRGEEPLDVIVLEAKQAEVGARAFERAEHERQSVGPLAPLLVVADGALAHRP